MTYKPFLFFSISTHIHFVLCPVKVCDKYIMLVEL
nr:MAG TPA: hypothetical protein [Caudoviricetes sp.]